MTATTPPDLPPFPVDDVTLAVVEHALGTALTYDGCDPEDGPSRVGGDYGMPQLLKFLSAAGDEDPCYHEHDVIAALIAEIRRLREDPR